MKCISIEFIIKGFIYQKMHFPQGIYGWLVSIGIISNTGEQDERGDVTLPPSVASGFDSGYLLGEIIRRLATQGGKKIPSALANVKPDTSKNARLTNWNFIWLAFEGIGLKLDGRIKELILQGEQALIVEVIRQLYEKDQQRDVSAKITVRMKSSSRARGHTQVVDIKKINLSKDPQESESSLQFLMLLLKASLGMSLEEILGLFTNQNKYLAHIIVKGLNENFSPIILFYSLLNKHSKKLRDFYEQDSKDAQACLLALKPGFISKNEQVSELTIELFGKLGNIYGWFISQDSKCSSTLLLGLKRHHNLRESYWSLLTQLIQEEEIEYFSMCYKDSFQNQQQQVEITALIIRYISQSSFCEKLVELGVVSSWLEIAMKLPEGSIEAQIECFRFIGEIMLYIPDIIDKTEECLTIFQRKWYEKTLPEFSNLFNELIVILEKLGEGKSIMARKIYMSIASIAKKVGPGDKRDYLVENFLPLIAKFPTIPSQYLIQHLRRSPLSSSQFLLICQSIEINQDVETLVAVGNFLKSLFIENPLLNFYTAALLKEIVQKSITEADVGIPFFQKLLQDTLFLFGNLEIKYKPKPKQQQSLYFGKKGSPDKISKQNEQQMYIKEKWKSVTLGLIMSLLDLTFSEENQEMKDLIREKLLNANAKIKLNNHKIGSKGIEEILYKRFGITKQEQVQHSEQFSKKQSANLEESRLNRSKAQSYVSVTSKLKGPDSLVKEFEKIAEKRKQEEEERRAIELKKQVVEEKKKLNVKKQLEIMNLLRGQVGEAQIREMGFLERLVQETKQLEVIPLEQLQIRQIQAIQSILKKYHRVLRHLFLTYTWTMYNSHSTQRFQDNQQRKQCLNVVQLGKMLKDYKLAFLTNQSQVIGLVRDINVKLLNKRQVNEIDFQGFQQFIIQFCGLIMTRKHTITTTTSQGQSFSSKNFKDLPLREIISQFFVYLKNVFITRGQKITVFQDVGDIQLTKQQQYQVDILTRKLQAQPNYILPQGYKKVSYSTVEFSYRISDHIQGISEAYLVALSVIDDILAKEPLGSHTLEDLSQKKTIYKVKPSIIGDIPKQRALSTYIQRKFPVQLDIRAKRSSSKGIIAGLNQVGASEKNIAKQAADTLLKIVDKVSTSLEKQKAKQKKIFSVAKLQELQSSKLEIARKKAKEKEEQRLAQLKKQKQEEKKRRQQTERFLEEQKMRLQQKKRKQQELRQKKLKQEEQKQAQKKENKQKFKSFHQGQLQKIKKISQEVLEKQRKQKQQEQQEKQRHQQLRKQLRQKIQEQDKRIVGIRKQSQKSIQTLFDSQPIKRVFAKFDSNLKAIFEFIVHNTFLSITDKKHNNQIVFEAWRQFVTVFDLSFIILPKDTAFIFKVLTKHKLVTKQYFIGLSFGQFQQALLRIAIKYQTIFNKIAQRIKDNIEVPEKPDPNAESKQKQLKKGKKNEKKQQKAKQVKQQQQQNQFDNSKQINIKQLIKETFNNKDSLEDYGDISKVNDRTLLGLIYYLRVPNTKVGQEKRFRDILSNKNSSFAHTAQRLKQKLSQQYTLQQQTKKPNQQKPLQNGSISQKSIK